MPGYIKLDKSLTQSSLWLSGSPEEIVLWVFLLTNADYHTGFVDASLPAIAHGCHLSNERALEILNKFAAPDPYSRSSEHEGRRVVIHRDPDWGISILNYSKYQQKDHTAAERKRRQRERERNEANIIRVADGMTPPAQAA